MMGATEGCSGTRVPSVAASLACPEVTVRGGGGEGLGGGLSSTRATPFVPVVWSLKRHFSHGLQRLFFQPGGPASLMGPRRAGGRAAAPGRGAPPAPSLVSFLGAEEGTRGDRARAAAWLSTDRQGSAPGAAGPPAVTAGRAEGQDPGASAPLLEGRRCGSRGVTARGQR